MSTPTKFRIPLRGNGILTSPRFNKGTAFTVEERRAFGLTGRLPCRVNTLDEQCDRAYDQLQSRDTPILKNSFLQSMKEQNWVLYYSLLKRHLRDLIPIIYTPTEVGGGPLVGVINNCVMHRLMPSQIIRICFGGARECTFRSPILTLWKKISSNRQEDAILIS